MAKYHLLWEVELSRTPVDANEKRAQWQMLQAQVREQMEAGVIVEWGQFAGEPRGYTIIEGSEIDLTKLTNIYAPFVRFTSRPVMSIEQVMKASEAL
jgi:hypothetical protein